MADEPGAEPRPLLSSPKDWDHLLHRATDRKHTYEARRFGIGIARDRSSSRRGSSASTCATTMQLPRPVSRWLVEP
jgi:hypothetical protein